MLRRYALLLFAPLAFAADVRVLEEIAVKVNGEIITKGEIAEREAALRDSLKTAGASFGRATRSRRTAEQQPDLLRGMIDELLLVHKGKEMDLKVEGDVNRQIAGYQLQSKISDPDKFHEYIRQQLGIPFEEFKDKLTNQALTQRVVGIEVSSHVNVPEPDLQKYYEEHKSEFVRKEQLYLSQILISTEGKTPQQAATAETRAKDVVARARRAKNLQTWWRRIRTTPRRRGAAASCRLRPARDAAQGDSGRGAVRRQEGLHNGPDQGAGRLPDSARG